jgi:predicted phage terminase large subunit-like protein
VPDRSRFQAVLKATVAENPWVKQVPTLTQSLFLAFEGQEALFGGAAGGGKSSALLMAALQYVTVPGYAALLLRRSYTDLALPGALMDRAYAWLRGTAAKWRDTDKTWRFPSGATLTFGYLESDSDKYRYQSSEFQFVGFDEVTQFEEGQYVYLFSRLRRLTGADVPVRMRAASNPGGVGHNFVKQRFLVEGPDAGRLFMPSKLDDNPHLDRDQYRASLMELDPFTRGQLLEGDWSEHSGGLFRREWFTTIDVPPELEKRVRAWDLAATAARPGKDPDWSAGVLLGRTREKQYVVLDVVRIRATPLVVQALVGRRADIDGRGVPVFMEEEGGSSGKIAIDHYRRNVLAGYSFHGVRSTGNKRDRAAPLSSMAEAGNVKLLRAPWNTAFLDELASFPQGAHDDQVDAASLAFAQLTLKQRLWVHATIETDPEWVQVRRPNGEIVWVPRGSGNYVDIRPEAPGWRPYGR